jgi:hypothetical protein
MPYPGSDIGLGDCWQPFQWNFHVLITDSKPNVQTLDP